MLDPQTGVGRPVVEKLPLGVDVNRRLLGCPLIGIDHLYGGNFRGDSESVPVADDVGDMVDCVCVIDQ